MFSTDPKPHPGTTRDVPPATDPVTPSGEWGWVVTADGRVVRATISAGVLDTDVDGRRAA